MSTISIIVPTHDRPDQLVAAVRSALAQRQVGEVVVVDDGSGPATAAAIRSMHDERVRFVRQRPGGGCRARNLGALEATGDWLAFLDDDDELLAGWGDALAPALDDPRCGIASCGVRVIDDAGAVSAVRLPRPMGGAYDDATALFVSGSFVVRRAVFEEAGGYVDGLPSGPHHELALRMIPTAAAAGLVVRSVDQPLVAVHQRPAGARWRHRATILHGGAAYLLEHHRDRLRRDPRFYGNQLAVAGVSAARMGEGRQARRLLAEAVRVDPRRPRHLMRLALAYLPGVGNRLWGRHGP